MNKTMRTVLIAVVAIVLVGSAFGFGYGVGNVFPAGNVFPGLKPALAPTLTTTPEGSQGGTPVDLQSQFDPFWQAWDLIHQNYLDQPVDNTKLVQGAISGMMTALGDPYSGYWTPKQTTNWNMAIQGSYDGIGAFVDIRRPYLTITKTIPGYPAEKAGLQTGDQIIAVDGKDVTGIDPDLVRMTMILGKAGTDVHLSVQRKGVDKPLEFIITRATIVIPSVTSKMLDNKIAYIQILTFGETTTTDFHNQLNQLMTQNPTGIILDLRDNLGGLRDAGVAVASEFIDHGVIISEQYSDGSKAPFDAIPGGLATKIPMVVLVNGYTASASEIVAGAIQDDGRGKLVGELTYGKGVVQTYFPLSDGGTARITSAKWLTPNGRTIEKLGLTPDLVVKMTPADVTAGKDPQLDAAIQLLLHPQP